MHQFGAFSLSVEVAEEVEDIIRRCCRPATGSGRNDEDERVKLIGYPTFPYLPGEPLHRRQYVASPCLELLGTHDDWQPLWVSRGL